MPLIPQNTNPLQDYVNPGSNAAMTIDGIVVDGVYAFTGVIDSITNNNNNIYQDPSSNQITSPGQVSLYNNAFQSREWVSPLVDDEYNTGFQIGFSFNRITFVNVVLLQILNVPCTWTLSQVNISTGASTELFTNTILDNTSTWLKTTARFQETYQFDPDTNLVLTISKLTNGLQYNLGVKGLLAKLQVVSLSDLDSYNSSGGNTTISGFISQNSLGFVENYQLQTDNLSNMLTLTTSGTPIFWKSEPQPVKDAVIYFIVDLGYTQTINKMYMDPLYSGSILNLYYSDDCINWISIPKDLTLRRGIYDLPQINGRYIKLEITQLTPEPYNLPFDSILKTVNVFPDWIDSYFITLEQALLNTPSQNYFPTTSNPAPNVIYNNSPSTPTSYGLATDQLSNNTYGASVNIQNIGAANYGVSNTDYSIIDPTISYKSLEDISNIGSIYANVDTTTFINRRFMSTGPHEYKQVTINQTWHQAYFTGIKYLSFYCYNPLVDNGREDFYDYFFPTSTNGITFTPSPSTLINTVSGTTATLVSGGGYTGLAGTTIQTQSLNTINQFKSFKFGVSNTDWQLFLSPISTTLQGSIPVTGVTISGVFESNVNINTTTSGYGIYTISNSPGTTYIKSPNGGGLNLLTSAEANFSSGGWSGGPSVTGSNVTISGLTLIPIPLLSNATWEAAYGEVPYAFDGFATSPTFGAQQNEYDFLVTASGIGNTTITIDYLNSSGVTVSGGTFTQITSVSGVANLNFLTIQPLNSSQVKVSLTTSGSITYSQAGLFYGPTSSWVSPLITSNMRVSAVARIYLPSSNFGTYTCGLYTSTNILLAQKSFSNIPTQTWVDIEVPYTLPSTGTTSQFYVKLTQTFGKKNGVSEPYEISLLGIFYNPVTYQFTIDNGANWYTITTGVNDINASINLPAPTQRLVVKGTILEDNSIISGIDIVPVYTQTPYYTNTIINYLGDPKVNQMTSRDPVALKPLFQLGSELHPLQYGITQLMNIPVPFALD